MGEKHQSSMGTGMVWESLLHRPASGPLCCRNEGRHHKGTHKKGPYSAAPKCQLTRDSHARECCATLQRQNGRLSRNC